MPGLGGGHHGELAPCPLISQWCSHHLHPTLMQSVGFSIPGHGPGLRGNNRGHYSLNKRNVFFQEFWKSKITVSSRLVSGEAASLVLRCVPMWPLICLRRYREKDLSVSSYSYKDTSPMRPGPHPYDLNDFKDLFEGLTSIYYHTGG